MSEHDTARETAGSPKPPQKPTGRLGPLEIGFGLALAAAAVFVLLAKPNSGAKRPDPASQSNPIIEAAGRDVAAAEGVPVQVRDGGASSGAAETPSTRQPSPSADDVAAELKVAGELKVAIKPDDVAVFMRAKLEHSQDVIKGLALGDFQTIYRAAHDLALASQASAWEVLLTEDYARQSAEFRRSCESLRKAARDENLDAASLAWMEVTMKCIQCHKYVREADGNAPGGAFRAGSSVPAK